MGNITFSEYEKECDNDFDFEKAIKRPNFFKQYLSNKKENIIANKIFFKDLDVHKIIVQFGFCFILNRITIINL